MATLSVSLSLSLSHTQIIWCLKYNLQSQLSMLKIIYVHEDLRSLVRTSIIKSTSTFFPSRAFFPQTGVSIIHISKLKYQYIIIQVQNYPHSHVSATHIHNYPNFKGYMKRYPDSILLFTSDSSKQLFTFNIIRC